MAFTISWLSTTATGLKRRVRRWLCDARAVTAAEYAILMALIILVSVASIRMIGTKFFNLYTMISSAVGDTM